MKNRKSLLVTLADNNFIKYAKQLFSSAYWNAGWKGDYMLLSHEIPEKELEWFNDKGILIKRCKPLYDKKIGKENYPPVVLDKFYLFTPEFRKWGNIVFLDGDIIVRASLDALTKVKCFASPNVMGDKLELFFHKDSDPINYQTLKEKYNLSSPAFNSGVMAFPSKIIENDTFNNLMKLFETYKTITSGDDPIFNLLFYKKWKKLPVIYDISPKTIEKYTAIPANNVKGVIIHLKENETSDNKYIFYQEWKKNLEKSEYIDLNKILKVKKWNIFKINFYSFLLKTKFYKCIIISKLISFYLHRLKPFFLYIIYTPDRFIGEIGFFIKKHKPELYFKLKKKKERYPSVFNIEITNSCMAKCHQCDMWGNKNPINELTLEEKFRLIEEIKDIKGHRKPWIHFTGGEPFLKKEELLKLADFCTQKKIYCGVNTTGYFLDEVIAEKISKTRLKVFISLDSIIPEIHDEMRRLEDCHKRALMAIDYLIKYGGENSVVILSVLTKKNLNEFDKLIMFANKKNIKIKFQPLMLNMVKNPRFIKEEYWPDEKGKIDEVFCKILNIKKQGYSILTPKSRISSYKDYFYKGISRIKCKYYKRNLCIDSLGDVRFCQFSEPIGNIRENSLKNIYHSNEAEKIKNKLKNCNNRSCSLSFCQDPPDLNQIFHLNRIFHLNLIFHLTQIFHYTINTPNRLIGKFGAFLKKHMPELYNKLKR